MLYWYRMKIHIIADNVVVPGVDAFLGGQTYIVPAELGKMLVERNQAEEVEDPKSEETAPSTPSKKVRDDKK